MQYEECLNCCELMQQLIPNANIKLGILEMIKAGYLTKVHRIYIGSYFCSRYFLSLLEEELGKVIKGAREENIKVTLVLPIFTQGVLEEAKQKIEHLSIYFGVEIDEITVNDYGMLAYISSRYDPRKVGINLGRLLMKDYRDPRYLEYCNIPLKPRSFTSYMRSLIEKYGIKGLEFDPTHRVIDFSDSISSVIIGLHMPYCYETVGQICEVASIGKPISEKFRPNTPCTLQCLYTPIYYKGEEGCEWIKYGRTVYFKNEQCTLKGLSFYRKIVSPLERGMECSESISAT